VKRVGFVRKPATKIRFRIAIQSSQSERWLVLALWSLRAMCLPLLLRGHPSKFLDCTATNWRQVHRSSTSPIDGSKHLVLVLPRMAMLDLNQTSNVRMLSATILISLSG
jgi:hypothetical protein